MKGVAAVLAGCFVAIAAAAQHSRPDVFLITIDTLRADHVECYGYEHVRTPAISRLCDDGIRFTQAFTPSPITNASHTTIFTGLLPSHHGVTDFAIPLSAEHETIAGLLRNAGYHTAAFIGAVILDSNGLAPGLDHGFDFYDNFPPHTKARSRWGWLERRGMDVVTRGERWLDAHPKGPHFVWIHLYDPHDPYEPPAPYAREYRGHLYDGEIAYADAALGQFLKYLDQHGRYRDALIVLVGDHGEGLGEHNEDTHGIFLYDSTTHVPLIFKLPGNVRKGRVIPAQVRTTDILPTVLDLLSLAIPGGLDGQSLKAGFSAEGGVVSRPALGETDYPLQFGWAPLRSLRSQNLKFIEAPRPEFYNLNEDPHERKNIYEPWNVDVQKFRTMMADAHLNESVAGKEKAVSSSTIAELKALGYFEQEVATNVPKPSLLSDPKDKIEEQNLLHRALLASESGHTAEARRALQKVLQEDADSVIALRQMGELEVSAHEYEQAANHLTRARRLKPNDALLALEQGKALARLGEFRSAREALEASVRLLPGQSDARRLLADVDMKLWDPKAAADELEAALLLQPGNAELQTELARAFLADHKFSDAAQQLEEVAKLEPKNAELYSLLARAYDGLGKKDLAQKSAAHAAELRRRAKITPH
jgi:arylsulfatase A-like enzyme/Flp pilus assembly protein TadD